jgi:hypothetical protein
MHAPLAQETHRVLPIKGARVHRNREVLVPRQGLAPHRDRNRGPFKFALLDLVDAGKAGGERSDAVLEARNRRRAEVRDGEMAASVAGHKVGRTGLRRETRRKGDAGCHIGVVGGAKHHLVRRGGDGAGSDRGRVGESRARAEAQRGAVGAGRHRVLAESDCSRSARHSRLPRRQAADAGCDSGLAKGGGSHRTRYRSLSYCGRHVGARVTGVSKRRRVGDAARAECSGVDAVRQASVAGRGGEVAIGGARLAGRGRVAAGGIALKPPVAVALAPWRRCCHRGVRRGPGEL